MYIVGHFEHKNNLNLKKKQNISPRVLELIAFIDDQFFCHPQIIFLNFLNCGLSTEF